MLLSLSSPLCPNIRCKALGKWNFTEKKHTQWKLMYFFIRWELLFQSILNQVVKNKYIYIFVHSNILLKNFPQRKCSTTINHFLQLPKLFFTLFQNRLHSISSNIYIHTTPTHTHTIFIQNKYKIYVALTINFFLLHKNGWK